ncbi:hypothetical protein tb265_29450 [Gemmatimonadetes bacterium T265]|nr:hypothetical protein tb265_29450 [Gemmatimonadetes bacterium T265]
MLALAFDLENGGRSREAASAFRRAFALADPARDAGTRDAALLGLERAWIDAGQPDSVLAVVAAALRQSPADAVAHAIALRTLATLRRDADARAAYDQWRRAAPADAAPYVEFARLLLDAGQRATADSVLADAARAPLAAEARRVLLPSRARALAAAGAWIDAARTWRDVLAGDPEYVGAVVYALGPAPDSTRDGVVGALAPVVPNNSETPARRAAVGLLVRWHRATAAWGIASALPPDTAGRELWRGVASELDASGARRDGAAAWRRALDASPPASVDAREAFGRAVDDALQGGDAVGALALLDARSGATGAAASDLAAASVRVLRVRALAALGRADDAERAAADLPTAARAAAANALADAWIARGDLGRAADVLRRSGADSSEAAGWLALAGGDLRRARAIFARTPPSGAAGRGLLGDVRAAARAALARTRADSAPALGAALVAAARGDAPAAGGALEQAAAELADARSLLLAAAADVAVAAGNRARAAALWRQLLADATEAPEAPAADLAWARSLLAAGDRAAARARFEHLVTTYPESALVPIARRELERLGSA